MLIHKEEKLEEVWKKVQYEIRRGALDRKHPFRYLVLTTVGDRITSRYVVLRQVDDAFRLIIYTDARSKKIQHLKSNSEVQILFYHPQKQVQVIVAGFAEVASNDEFASRHWSKVTGNAKRSYTTEKAPGTPIKDPGEGHVWDENAEEKYFATLTITPTVVEVLQLNRSEHLRALFERSNDWSGTWLVP